MSESKKRELTEYYRGESRDYGDTTCMPSIFREEGYDLLFEMNFYKKLTEEFHTISIFNSLDKKMEQSVIKLKELGVLQHYGYPTRLLDVTRNKDVALYFACQRNFDQDGKLYTFNSESVQEIKSPDAKSILRKMECIWKADDLVEHNVWHYLNIPTNAKYTITNNILIDYRGTLKDVIGRIDDNLRLSKQDGAFILFGHKVNSEGYLKEDRLRLEEYTDESIAAKDKFTNLVELLCRNESLSYVQVYPDDKQSMDLKATWNKLVLYQKYEKLDLWSREYRNIIMTYFKKEIEDDSDRKLMEKIIDDGQLIMNSPYLFYFICTDFLQFWKEAKCEGALKSYDFLIKKWKEVHDS